MTATKNGRRTQRVTRRDLEAAFAKALGEGETAGRAALPKAIVLAGALSFTVIVLAYLAGRRRGRRSAARIEIRQG